MKSNFEQPTERVHAAILAAACPLQALSVVQSRADMETALTVQQTSRKQELEAIVTQGISRFVEVGNALLEISRDRLYRDEFNTFEDYLKEKWGICRSYGYSLMQTAKVAEEVSEIVDIKNGAIAMEIAKLPTPSERKQAATKIAKTIKQKRARKEKPQVTAEEARAIAEKITGKKPVAKPTPIFDAEPTEEKFSNAQIVARLEAWKKANRFLFEHPPMDLARAFPKILALFGKEECQSK